VGKAKTKPSKLQSTTSIQYLFGCDLKSHAAPFVLGKTAKYADFEFGKALFVRHGVSVILKLIYRDLELQAGLPCGSVVETGQDPKIRCLI